MITVGIVDDDRLARTVLTDMVRSRSGEFSVAAAVPSVDRLLTETVVEKLDVVILDVRLGPGNHLADNIEALTTLGTAILAVTSDTARGEIVPALRHRAISILDKDDLDDRLHDALRLTAAGTVVIAPSIQSRLQAQASPVPDLTPRQQDVFRLFASGLPLKSVARRLGIGYKTAYDHVEEIRRRFRSAGRPIDDDLSWHYAAIELGYIPDPRDSD
jgi:DNA-binding NarL/FixJ family response regulator